MTPNIFNTKILGNGLGLMGKALTGGLLGGVPGSGSLNPIRDEDLKVKRAMVPDIIGKDGMVKKPEYNDPFNQRRSRQAATIFAGLFNGT